MAFWEIVSLHSEAIATFVSVGAAGIFGWRGFRQNQRRSRREYTLGLMLQRFQNDAFFLATRLLSECIENDEVLDIDALSEVDRDAVIRLLTFLEFIAAAYRRDSLDKSAVRDQLQSVIVQSFDRSRTFIHQRREKLKRPKLYEHLEWLADQWR